jgi:hypothetical protein
MSKSIPIALSSLALLVSVLATTGMSQPARDAVVLLFAKNAGAVNGIKASKSRKRVSCSR